MTPFSESRALDFIGQVAVLSEAGGWEFIVATVGLSDLSGPEVGHRAIVELGQCDLVVHEIQFCVGLKVLVLPVHDQQTEVVIIGLLFQYECLVECQVVIGTG